MLCAIVKTVSLLRLRQILASVTHATPIGFTALTDAGARVNPLGPILKLTKVNAFASADYTKAVNRALAKDGKEADFAATGRANQTERIGPCLARKVVKGEERFYLPVHVRHAREPLYLARQSSQRLRVVPKEQVVSFLPVSKPRNQDVVVYRDYALTSLTSLSINGEQYRIRQ